jgi:hypothetical protein
VKQLGDLAYTTLACGPLCGLFIPLLALPAAIDLPDFGFLNYIWFVSLMYVMGMLAGLISGGALQAPSSLLWPGPKTVKKGKRCGVWDTELDGPV